MQGARDGLADDESSSRGDYEMKDPETRTVFAGLDGRSDAQLPNWYAEQKPVDDPVTFTEAIRDLPQAIETTVAYQNPYSDEWVETERFNAVVEPTRLREQGRGGDDVEPLFHIPTDSYAIINPVDVYGPLEEVLREETIDGQSLGDVMFGEVRRYRGGGEVHMDVMFDGLEQRRRKPSGRSAPAARCALRALRALQCLLRRGSASAPRPFNPPGFIAITVTIYRCDRTAVVRSTRNRLTVITISQSDLRNRLLTWSNNRIPHGAEVSWNGQYLRTVWPVQRRFLNHKF